MEPSTWWWVLTGCVIVAELLTGTIYLLLVATGMAAGAIGEAMGATSSRLSFHLTHLEAAGLDDAIGTEHFYPTLPTAVTAYLSWHAQTHGRPHPFGPVP